MSLKFEISGVQADGARDYQEDSFLFSHLQDGDTHVSLVIVADGMGGHAAGNVASKLAVQAFNTYVTTHYSSNLSRNDQIHSLLISATDEANNSITGAIKETSALKGMGCTLVAALCINEKMYWASVGDSHLFHVQNKTLIKRNADHSYGGYLDRMAAEGNEINEESGYSRHMLLSALTGEPIPTIDCPEQPVPLKKGDQILLCSDGIDTLDQKSIQTRCNNTDNSKDLSRKLLQDVTNEQLPRQDNTTIIAVCVETKSNIDVALPETILSPSITRETPSPSINKTPPAQVRPTKYATETKFHDRTRKKSSSLSWFIPFCILTALAAGGWWYLNEKPIVNVSELVFEEEITEPGNTEMVDGNPSAQADPKRTETITSPNQAQTADKITPFRDKLTSGVAGPEMIWIPAGSFEMGGTGTTPPVNERPRHKVTLAKFAISSKEISRGEFAKFSKIAVSNTNKNQPVRNVSWKTAQKYVKWLSKQTRATYRLPSEAEWEYAARAGTTSPYWWGYKTGTDNALCFGCGIPLEPTRPNDTGSFAANTFGLYDTAGNVAEWIEDCYHGNYEEAPTDGSAWNTGKCKERVLRGGSYLNATKSLYVSRRDKLAANKSKNNIGFRIVRER